MPDTKLKVLVVDDDPSYRDLAREALTGHERWIASTAREGLELFLQQQPDIVFLDLSLPDDNGLEVLLEMREERPEAYVVILTTSRLTDDVMMAQRCAANGYITKPFSRKQLQQYCESCVEYWQRIQAMNGVEHMAFCSRQREEAQRMQTVLHAPTPQSKAALEDVMPRWKVMVVGTTEQGAQAWKAELDEAGCQVTHIQGGAEAFHRLKEDGEFRLLLVEDTLPDSDASELLYRLRVNRQFIPAIVVVDEDWKQRQPKWRRVGANRVLRAPLHNGKLRTMVEKEIARSLEGIDDIFLQL